MSKRKILVIEDSHELAYQLRLRLEKAGYDVVLANDGSQGLEMAREQKPSLILLDLMLPELDGYRLARLLKFDRDYEKIPIVVLTARSLEEDRKLAIETGADAYLLKPVEWPVLLETLGNMLETTNESVT